MNTEQHKNKHRRSIRLPKYDYTSSGWYYITICTQNRELFFENNKIKQITSQCWLEIPNHFNNVELDEYTIMPNHIHGIIRITENGYDGNDGRGVACNAPTDDADPNRYSTISPKSRSLAAIIRSYKSAVTKWCHENGFNNFQWQRNYFESIIRDKQSLDRIRKYIRDNHKNWNTDKNNPKNWEKQ